ncbi:MAG: glycosyltransferase family 4 protein [Candidatus Pristimantibacillus lignocellulolyticus]|uniref:Glycosyltransferase family 4 protein n=1 Tax=Candidatus Pristimantibacillus lignocellulolyticus TaxID=2994561 RepID=A0A9J6ZIB0_9BACL|nr:MAG: glycosyltransferase family 4 protein [Candidatus Pristimantibacillus lignocellulolyticus]
MSNKKSFYLLAPYMADNHLTKDIGIIPYIMQKYVGYKAVFATYKPPNGNVTWPTLQLYSEDIEIDYIEPSFEYHPEHVMDTVFSNNVYDCGNDLEQYIESNASKINVLFIFGFYQFYYNAINKYKELNPTGKVYLKLDANIIWINNTILTDEFTKFLGNCDIISSETMVEYISQKWSVPIHYIPNGYYSLGNAENGLDKIFAFEEKEDIIFTAARLGHPAKATDVLLEGFRLAVPHIPSSWRLVLAGSVEESFKPYIEKFAQENPELNERIVFLGFTSDREILNDWFIKAKIFVFPSAYEGYANVLSEAKVHGCYLIGSDIESNRDAASKHELRLNFIDDQYKLQNRYLEYGSLHTVGLSYELALRMIETCNDQTRLETVCYSTQRDASEHFDWVKLCKKIDSLLQETTPTLINNNLIY